MNFAIKILRILKTCANFFIPTLSDFQTMIILAQRWQRG